MRGTLFLVAATCSVGILAASLLVTPRSDELGETRTPCDLPAPLEDREPEIAAEATVLDPVEAPEIARAEAAPVPCLADVLAPVYALPESTPADVTAKREALQAALVEHAPKKAVLRIRPGVDWKAEQRAKNPEFSAAGDEMFRLKKLERDTRYEEYVAAKKRAGAARGQ